MPATIGAMTERIIVQKNNAAISVSSITRSGSVATATTASAHGYSTGDYVTIAGASPSGYNGKVKITVTGSTTFTYTVSSGLSTPATGTKTATFTSNAQGGGKDSFSTLDTVWAEMAPVRASERLAVNAISAQLDYRFRIYYRSDVTELMRILWTPSWSSTAAQQVLEIHGVLPDGDGRFFQTLECGRAA